MEKSSETTGVRGMKKFFGIAAAVAVLAVSSAALAGNAGDGSGYGTQPGFDNAIANSNGCAGAGSPAIIRLNRAAAS